MQWRNPVLSGRIPELDGIRGLAILQVLIYHFLVDPVRADTTRSWLSYAVFPLRLTWSGVDLFFVLSGFLIGGILCDARNADGYYRTFYLRRVHRIFPLYFIWLALFWAGLFFAEPSPLFNRELPVWSYAFFLQNVFSALRSTWGAGWLGITWSLAVEEQFYLLLPAVIRRATTKTILSWTLGAIALAPVFRIVLDLSGTPFFGPYVLLPCRADALGCGVLLALAFRDRSAWEWLQAHRPKIRAAFGVLGCGAAILIFYPKGLLIDSVGYTWLAAFYSALLIVVLVNPGHPERAVFGHPLLIRLGTYAYAIYLTHEGINGLCHQWIRGAQPSIRDLPAAGVTVISLAIVMALAAASWRFLEQPLIRRGHERYNYGGNQSKSNRPTIQRTVQRF